LLSYIDHLKICSLRQSPQEDQRKLEAFLKPCKSSETSALPNVPIVEELGDDNTSNCDVDSVCSGGLDYDENLE
jgi:hypothetical protein